MRDIISLIAEDVQLQSDEKRQLTEDLKSLLSEYGIEQKVRLYDGPIYAQTSTHMDCPECGDQLKLQKAEYDAEDGVTASVECTCGWRGRGVYRLVDLETHRDMTTREDYLESGSCVAADNLTVAYVPYKETDVTEA